MFLLKFQTNWNYSSKQSCFGHGECWHWEWKRKNWNYQLTLFRWASKYFGNTIRISTGFSFMRINITAEHVGNEGNIPHDMSRHDKSQIIHSLHTVFRWCQFNCDCVFNQFHWYWYWYSLLWKELVLPWHWSRIASNCVNITIFSLKNQN